MKIPLNQIFYGPPGTGKTYRMSLEAEKIVNQNISTASTREEKFNLICESIRNISGLEIKSNSLYRNERAILWIFGYMLEPPHDQTNRITNREAINNGLDPSPSSWAQYSQYLTHFGFVKDWTKSTEIELNQRGIELKNKLKKYIDDNGLSFRDLKNWNKDAPDIVREAYFNAICEVERENFTNQLKVIYCVLNLALNKKLRAENEYQKKDIQDRIDASVYIDIDDYNTDIKWIGQIGRSLRGLGIVNDLVQDDTKETYLLSKTGFKLVDQIIQRWELQYPDLFGDHLSYEAALEHGRIKYVTFHQSYSYEEFVEGIRPNMDNNELTYSLDKGVFREIADNAKNFIHHNYVLIIDEINRGNISKIFGELITLIEPSKRLFSDDPKEQPKQVTLAYSKKLFGVPKNLFILGTMNTADRSIALLDSALRRRFSFIEMVPQSSVLKKENIKIDGIDIEKLFETINERIEFLIDKDHRIGHSYFLKIKDQPTIKSLGIIFKNEIIPLLMEYFYGDFEKVRLIMGDNKEWKSNDREKFFVKKSILEDDLFGKTEIEGYEDKEMFALTSNLDIDDDGNIKGETTVLINLFKSVYTKKAD